MLQELVKNEAKKEEIDILTFLDFMEKVESNKDLQFSCIDEEGEELLIQNLTAEIRETALLLGEGHSVYKWQIIPYDKIENITMEKRGNNRKFTITTDSHDIIINYDVPKIELLEELVETINELKAFHGVEYFVITEYSKKYGVRKIGLHDLEIDINCEEDKEYVNFTDMFHLLEAHMENPNNVPYMANMFLINQVELIVEAEDGIDDMVSYYINFIGGNYIKIDPFI
jgi:hypothetical protein